MKNKSKFLVIVIFLFAAIFTLNNNISAQAKNEILIVADQKASCRGIVAQDCLQAKHLNEESFSLFRQNIENFKFIPGYFYVLEVRVLTVANPPADSSSLKYRLRKVLARVKSENSSQPIPLPAPQNLSGIDWKLTRIEGSAVESKKALIRFDEQNRRAGGNSGCNGFGGTLVKNGNQIKISQIISTKMFCQEGSDIENKFLNNLERVTNYQITDNRLMLLTGNTKILEFEAQK